MLDDFMARASEISERLDGLTLEEKGQIMETLVARATVVDREHLELELVIGEPVLIDRSTMSSRPAAPCPPVQRL